MSFTHIATQSMPIVSCLSISKASLSLVPTPSVPLTSTGSLTLSAERSNIPPKAPMLPITPNREVEATCFLMRRTTSYPASRFTPAFS